MSVNKEIPYTSLLMESLYIFLVQNNICVLRVLAALLGILDLLQCYWHKGTKEYHNASGHYPYKIHYPIYKYKRFAANVIVHFEPKSILLVYLHDSNRLVFIMLPTVKIMPAFFFQKSNFKILTMIKFPVTKPILDGLYLSNPNCMTLQSPSNTSQIPLRNSNYERFGIFVDIKIVVLIFTLI